MMGEATTAETLPSKALAEMFGETLKHALRPPTAEALQDRFPSLPSDRVALLAKALHQGLTGARGFCEAEFGSICAELDLPSKLDELFHQQTHHQEPKFATTPPPTDLAWKRPSVQDEGSVDACWTEMNSKRQPILLKHRTHLIQLVEQKGALAERLQEQLQEELHQFKASLEQLGQLKAALSSLQH